MTCGARKADATSTRAACHWVSTTWLIGVSVTPRMQSMTFRASRGVACASTTMTLSSPMMTPGLGSPSAVKAQRPSPMSVDLILF
jgi:hypothetical protein